MLLRKQLFVLYLLLFSFNLCNAQIEVARASAKGFNGIGFGGVLNFSLPVSEAANFLTIEGGLQYFKNQYDENLGLIPVLIGYRYTLNQTGEGLYIEPDAGYTFGASSIQTYNSDGAWMGDVQKVAGATAGIGAGYLLQLGNVPFNVGLRYHHNFGNYATNIWALRILHSFSFGRRNND